MQIFIRCWGRSRRWW